MNGLHRYGCNTCSTSQHAEGNVHEHATHWICPHCQDEVSVKRSVRGCGKWRPRNAPLINHGQAAEDRFVAKGAEAAVPVVLNRREVVNQGAGLGLEAILQLEGYTPFLRSGNNDTCDAAGASRRRRG